MKHVKSADGTRIAFEKSGQGPAVIFIAGAFCDRQARASGTPLAALLPHISAYCYDRRGRGDSSETLPWSIEREVEDIAALIAEAGGSAALYGMSSGAVLALEAASRKLAITKIALYEPPVAVISAHRVLPEDLPARLEELCHAGKLGDAAALFLTAGVGMPAPAVAQMRQAPMWPGLERLAPTLAYDARLTQDPTRCLTLAPKLSVVTRVLCGAESPAWLREGSSALSEALPSGSLRVLAGQTHDVAPAALAPALAEFFG